MGDTVRSRLPCLAGCIDRRRGFGSDPGRARLIELAHLQVLSAGLFAIGVYGVLARRSAVMILMSIELMLNAVNINLVGYAAFSRFFESQRVTGQVLVIFVITIAAAELALAMAIILRLYRNRSTVNIDEIDLMKW
ncbi:MAG: NADH-quinone oxidoreductase subunit NuoK [SAR202 cluster bacterium]|nr:NADH-quinone oxidoreductase subunit NuoK [Chloroflexota bacterium]MQG57403.1 NADH-quinone oxidoreductase subunit NuoK [SAR202 cluster bacterium]MQG69863.1 NADH-quinone oxidoreductase subunit NuoK [SAR202 cluster bacterium]HAL48455.1 NADH-quinone oxidoreductase subunit NuoK [Dehalococcoidia bacterium]